MIGMLGKKKGMTSLYDQDGKQLSVTVIEVGPCPIVQVKTEEKDGYSALQLGFDSIREKNVTKPVLGHFKKNNIAPKRHLGEFKYDIEGHKVGDTLDVSVFKPGDIVNVIGTSKGRGFSGVIKRHGFHRPNQSHGTHENFRGAGSIGAGSYPGRVFPGVRMPGRYGGARITTKNLKVVRVDVENSLLILKGAVPGKNGGLIRIEKVK